MFDFFRSKRPGKSQVVTAPICTICGEVHASMDNGRVNILSLSEPCHDCGADTFTYATVQFVWADVNHKKNEGLVYDDLHPNILHHL